MTASTVERHLADRLAELSRDNVFGAPVDHRQERDQLEPAAHQLDRLLWGDLLAADAGTARVGNLRRGVGRSTCAALTVIRLRICCAAASSGTLAARLPQGSAATLGGIEPRKRVS